jgi:hypothetical protein
VLHHMFSSTTTGGLWVDGFPCSVMFNSKG